MCSDKQSWNGLHGPRGITTSSSSLNGRAKQDHIRDPGEIMLNQGTQTHWIPDVDDDVRVQVSKQ